MMSGEVSRGVQGDQMSAGLETLEPIHVVVRVARPFESALRT